MRRAPREARAAAHAALAGSPRDFDSPATPRSCGDAAALAPAAAHLARKQRPLAKSRHKGWLDCAGRRRWVSKACVLSDGLPGGVARRRAVPGWAERPRRSGRSGSCRGSTPPDQRSQCFSGDYSLS